MEIRRILPVLAFALCLFTFPACGGNGTEVASVPNPSDTPMPGKKKFETPYYTLSIDVPEGWTFIEYTVNVHAGSEGFKDIADPNTEAAAYFEKSGLGYFTVFASEIAAGETLVDYIRLRRPDGEIQDIQIGTLRDTGEPVFGYIYVDTNPGPNTGVVFDLYMENEGQIVWMRTELIGTLDEIEQTFTEFEAMVNSIEIEF